MHVCLFAWRHLTCNKQAICFAPHGMATMDAPCQASSCHMDGSNYFQVSVSSSDACQSSLCFAFFSDQGKEVAAAPATASPAWWGWLLAASAHCLSTFLKSQFC